MSIRCGLIKNTVALAIGFLLCSSALSAEPHPFSNELWDTLNSNIHSQPAIVLSQLQAHKPAPQANDLLQSKYHALLSRTYYALSYPELARQHSELSLRFIESESAPTTIHHLIRLLAAQAFEFAGEPSRGLHQVNKVLEHMGSAPPEYLERYLSYVKGSLHNGLGNYPEALENMLAAQSLAANNETWAPKAQIYHATGQVYAYRGEHELALPFYYQSLQISRNEQQPLHESIVLYEIGRSYRLLERYEEAKDVLSLSKEVAAAIEDLQGVAYAAMELAEVLTALNEYELAEEQIQSALDTFTNSGNPYAKFDVTLNYANLLLDLNQLDGAKRFFALAYAYLDPESMPLERYYLDESHARLLAQLGKHEAAYQLLANTIESKSALLGEQSQQALHTLRVNYEVDIQAEHAAALAKQTELQTLKLDIANRQKQQWILIACLLLIIVVTVLGYLLKLRQHRQSLLIVANRDHLTQLLSRRCLFESISSYFGQSVKPVPPYAVAFIDFDDFKAINDNYGHHVGDKVLEKFGEACKALLRSDDFAGRVGGDEFMIFLPNTASTDAKKIIERLSTAVRNIQKQLEISGLVTSISIGVVQFSKVLPPNVISQVCDEELYRAKQNNKGEVAYAEYDEKTQKGGILDHIQLNN